MSIISHLESQWEKELLFFFYRILCIKKRVNYENIAMIFDIPEFFKQKVDLYFNAIHK